MPFKSKLKNKVLSGQCRELVSNILRFMEAEAITGKISIPLAKDTYDERHTLSKCTSTVLEAKRVSLNEQLDKIANMTLSAVSTNYTLNVRQCKENFNFWENKCWKKIPNPKTNENNKKMSSDSEITLVDVDILNVDNLIKLNQAPLETCDERKDNIATKRKYFQLWLKQIQLRKDEVKLLENKIDQNRKLDHFVKHLRQKHKESIQKNENISEESTKHEIIKQPTKPVSIYKNRYTAQKNIIDMQKAKLEEQNKLIEELKLGIIREDLLKSIDSSKNDIRTIFSDCSERLKIKAPLVMAVEEREKFMVTTQKAPKVVQKMEQRAIERATNRQIILERKRLIDENRQRLLEEAIMKKKALEEDERKRYLEAIKEQRKKELEKENARQLMKQIFLEKENKAIRFYNKILLQRYFKRMHEEFLQRRENYSNATKFYNLKILRIAVNGWLSYVEEKYVLKYAVADAHFSYKILKAAIKNWKNLRIESIRSRQVAEDIYDLRLTSNTFVHWHRLVCKELTLRDKKMKIAADHHNRRLLFQCFYQWRSLPAVIQLEKAKEEKKRKWRQKVWEILPDYKPPKDI